MPEYIWYVAHNNTDVFHVGFIEPNQSLATGQPFLETFSSIELLNIRLVELNQPIYEQ